MTLGNSAGDPPSRNTGDYWSPDYQSPSIDYWKDYWPPVNADYTYQVQPGCEQESCEKKLDRIIALLEQLVKKL